LILSTFAERIGPYRQRVESALTRWLPTEEILPSRLHEAMRYATLEGGKRMRAMLVYAAGEALEAETETLDAPACAVELIHAYSLVHDDMPAMDDDALRRGKPTCHRAYDEATALLVGDALQSLAFQVLGEDVGMRVDAATRVRMITELARAAGSRGMAGGQAIDLASVGRQLSLAELENMHIHKTGALIRTSVLLGALASGAAVPETMRRLDHYAKCIGLAFQIQDDILDEEGDTATLGKTSGADRAHHKPTYPGLLGLAEAKDHARQLHDQALASIAGLGDNARFLREIADYVIERSY
jgi:geranylgeranyl pyrophosphate synthase